MSSQNIRGNGFEKKFCVVKKNRNAIASNAKKIGKKGENAKKKIFWVDQHIR